MAKYIVSATCTNDDCPTTSFQVMRRKMTYMSSEGSERLINRVVCPHCRMLGFVDKIATVDAGKEVAHA